jgi:hypothetical protein
MFDFAAPAAMSGEATAENFEALSGDHFHEIVSRLPDDELHALVEDLFAYNQAGLTSPRLADIFRRIECLAEAERLLAKFSDPSLHAA